MTVLENSNFIKAKIEHDLHKIDKVIVRFPPEPNGYLHLGHAKSIILNSSLAEDFNGVLNLRFDDTNPEKENLEYVNAIKRDAMWLTDKFSNTFWTSDYFDTIYSCAELLVSKGLAYVDDSSFEEIKNLRGDYNTVGVESVYRNRSIEENLKLFRDMKAGKYDNGEKVLRAKLDMTSSNLNMRDPILYRIKHVEHHNTGNKWCIYPMYDIGHPIADGIEGITHSICTMEFEAHRPLYNWIIEHTKELLNSEPTQIEFARLDIDGVLLSKRKLNALVSEGKVDGWNDTAMPTISGMRNRGYTADIIKDFVLKSGFSKANSKIDKTTLDDSVRNVLNPIAERRMCVIDPVEMEIINFSELTDEDVSIVCPNHPKNIELGSRPLTLTNIIYVERDDVRATAEKDFWRIYPGNWVRLKHGYNVLIKEVLIDNKGDVTKVLAEIDVDSKNMKMAKHKAKVALHWLSLSDAIDGTAYFYNNLTDNEGNYNESAKIVKNIKIEKNMRHDTRYEFERNGYFYFSNNVSHCLSLLKK
jgi:glutaminyl-tRNA synthetase